MTAKNYGHWHVRKVGDKWIAVGMNNLLAKHKNTGKNKNTSPLMFKQERAF